MGLENIKEVPLTQGKIAIVDAVDYERVAVFKWHATFSHGDWKARTWIKGSNPRKSVSLHRLILSPPTDRQIDHRDGDGLNNRRTNLRIATFSQNRCNTTSRSASGYKGVMPTNQQKTRWRAQIKVNGVGLHVGCFQSPEDAARAYDIAARQHFGEFACINFPANGERSARRGTSR